MRKEVWWRPPSTRVGLLCGATALLTTAAVAASGFTDWGPPVSAESLTGSSSEVNTPSNDGCPILSPSDGSLYMASNRPGGFGGLDIWIAPRSGDGWGAPVNAGPSINTAADEFCPSPAPDRLFFFVRRLSPTDTDIYKALKGQNGFERVERLPRGAGKINSDREEWSPSWFQAGGHQYLYFSSTRRAHPTQEVFFSVDYGNAQLAPGGVDSSASDARPNVRQDGLEIVWDSTRTGTLGGPDIWTATRSSVNDPWGTAVHLENGINSPANETRASLSADGRRLVFVSTRPGGEGSADIYVSQRSPN